MSYPFYDLIITGKQGAITTTTNNTIQADQSAILNSKVHIKNGYLMCPKKIVSLKTMELNQKPVLWLQYLLI